MTDIPFSWAAFWDEKALAPTDFQATGRSIMDIPGFLVTVREIVRILQPKKRGTLLDLGCGTGIISLALSPWVRRIHGVDISPAMVDRAKVNCALAPNVEFSLGTVTDPGVAGPFDRVLAYSILQYLATEDELSTAFVALRRLLPKSGRALYAANPDPARKEAYFQAAIQPGTPEDVKQKIVEVTAKTLWVGPDRMVALAREQGLEAKALPISKGIWQHFYMYDLVVWHG